MARVPRANQVGLDSPKLVLRAEPRGHELDEINGTGKSSG